MTILIMISLVVMTMLGLLIMPGAGMVIAASAVLSAVGIFLAIDLLLGRRTMRLTWVLAVALMAGYGGGALNTFVSFLLSGSDPFQGIDVPVNYIAFGFVMVCMASAILLAVGFVESPLFGPGDQIQFSKQIERFVWVSALLVLPAMMHGDLGYEGAAVQAGSRRVSAFGMLVSGLPFLSLPLVSVGLMQTKGSHRLRLIALFIAQAILIFPQGRRVLFYSLLVSIYVVVNLAGRKIHVRAGQVVGVLLIAALLGAASNYVFAATRLAMDETNAKVKGGTLNASLVDGIPKVLETIFYAPQSVMQYLSDTLRTRTFVIGYISLLGRGGNIPPPMLGQDALFAVQIGIPDIFYTLVGADKTNIRKMEFEEFLINEHFGLPVYDDANSILTAGIADFGLIGIMAYPVLLCILYRIFLSSCNLLFEPFVGTAWKLIAMNLYLQTEVGLDGYLSLFRSMLYFAVIWSLIRAIPDLRRGSKIYQPLAPLPES